MRGKENPKKKRLVEIANTTLEAIERGSYIVEDVGQIFLAEAISRCVEHTRLYPAEGVLSAWASSPCLSSSCLVRAQLPSQSVPSTPSTVSREKECKVLIMQTSTLAGARLLATTTARLGSSSVETERDDNKIGILNFASAKHPGGGFLNGAEAQEESVARSSTLYPSLMCPVAEPFYTLHRHDPQAGYYSHSMIYSPNVLLLRDDEGSWQRPVVADILTSPAVNAGVVKQSVMGRLSPKSETAKIERVMRERASRALYAFERNGVRHLVLGAWGCGVFQNDVRTIATIWADLLGREESRFRRSFDRVIFAVLGEKMYKEFEAAFTVRVRGDDRFNCVEVPNLASR
ncbi:uncharacterized protein FOMMEDRAFT_144210 [Fomitiporia mediterranea MF3/22]|uniref:uncharacterized protein n=1 Tax=Fomitiporia mediterranea (strain MF3/22) TaxID=694068 RepID=UPI0004407B31|nr:uncharacterized protein FOMMEDRAFT_144210 [Fomitiporia mediterranea MF3/22]EJD08153.1 hypothetical protein FOMMEDRAFT_144210 [Fomitiporia mediterranea MF3/22]